MQITLHPDYEHLRDWISQLPDNFFQLGEVIYDARNQIRIIKSPDGKAYNVKRYCQPIWGNRFIYTALRRPKAQRAYENALKLEANAIPTPTPIAYILIHKNGLLAESYLITEQSPLRRRLYEFGMNPQSIHQEIMQKFAQFTAQLHESGVLHLDYSPGNILWDIDAQGEVQFSLVDINRMRFAPVSFEEGCRNLQRLWGSEERIAQLGRAYALARGRQAEEGEQLLLHHWRKFWSRQKRCPFSPYSTDRPQSAVIVIPTYRATLDADEQLAVKQCRDILGADYDICFVAPESITQINGFTDLPIEHFNDSYFTDVAAYNRLMFAPAFYERFIRYDYMLIYQTDAYIFRNDLRRWLQMGYPYIGAPWLLKEKYRKYGRLLLHLRALPARLKGRPFRPLHYGDRVGNGGFSLRRVRDFYEVCYTQTNEINHWIEESRHQSEFNEDCFWSCRPDWVYPPVQEALTFSVDTHPEEALKQLHHLLPMACHGWSKPDYRRFWQQHIPMQQKRVIYYDYQAFTHQTVGGVSRVFTEIIRHLPPSVTARIGIRYSDNIYLRTLKSDVRPEDKRDGLLFKALARIAPRLFPYPKYANRAICAGEIKKGNYDLLHATYFDTYVLRCNPGKPLVITIHDMIDEIMGGSQTVPRRKALLAQRADHIIAVSQHTKDDIIRLLHIDPQKISVVYHAAEPLQQTPQQMPSLPERYILYVGGRARDYKNWPLFVQAIKPLLIEEKDLSVVCIGTPFTKAENAQLKQFGIADRFQVFQAEEDQLYTFYNRAQCFVYPSCYEGFGLPILEAWQSECPVLLSRSSCFPEIADEAALYHQENDADDLTNQMRLLLHDADLRHDLIRRGKQRLQHYSWRHSAQQLATIYETVIQKTKR